jgi:rubrerythrin
VQAFGSVDEVLDFAIAKEKESARFYDDLAARTKKPWMRQVFEDFANEERGHKAKLLAIKEGQLLLPAAAKVMDLKLADYLTDVKASPDLDYQEALVLAMKEEKASFKLYSDLAAATDDETLRTTLLALAQEEAKHKLRFEIEYDEEILTDN